MLWRKRKERGLRIPTGQFKMAVEDVFSIKGRGTVVTGKITLGTISVGDTVYRGTDKLKVAGLETYRELLQTASAGMEVGILLKTSITFVAGDELTK